MVGSYGCAHVLSSKFLVLSSCFVVLTRPLGAPHGWTPHSPHVLTSCPCRHEGIAAAPHEGLFGRDYAEASSFLRSDLIFFADGIVAAIQIDIEHGPIVAQIDLKVELQAGMCLHHGFDQSKA
eukprot:scaffold50401_cov59-Phaeocystis_antarctica.AAC.1